MKYIDYYPPVLKELREIKVIADVMDGKLDPLKEDMEKTRDECFILTANDKGLEKWERILQISVSDENDKELRRFNILAKLMNNRKYLIDILDDLIGKNGYTLRYYESEIRLEVVLKLERMEYFESVRGLLDEFVPVNVELDISIAYNTHNVLSKYTHNQLKNYRHNELITEEEL